MPSIISHPAVTLALKPFFQKFKIPLWITLLGAFCTIIPDFDVIGFAFDVEYESMLGHRGITHSLFFAAVLSGLIVLSLKDSKQISKPACFVFLFLCTASHGFFDALT
ncbi:MAG TPA: metal-dependent hydrolase, partial [Blastocatellia bacterium]|nr:metal-dependent hydrolase [Blastocatellia bacterium]